MNVHIKLPTVLTRDFNRVWAHPKHLLLQAGPSVQQEDRSREHLAPGWDRRGSCEGGLVAACEEAAH